ncbi:hypothetical protein ABVN58_12055 [Fusobacterium polymorphum]|jgi:hypothetical protein|uniref:Uncharacterized protein n=1 Tax=Fusobacterium nucleatum CTI-6 TaxID=1316587 RepID=U7TQ23_FUSNU|nr:hypothetical protein [Fusobacterium nucleatum]ERT46460.1 hypothetical protein HMPREF1767_01918 [Fusobacterium nucleatum CTI-6]
MKIEYEKIEEILRNLINDCGENILLESNKMSSLLKDYFPRMDTERNLLLEVTKIGIWNKLISLKTKKKNLQISGLNECLESILKNTFIKEDIAIKLLEILADIFGLKNQLNCTKNNLEVTNLEIEKKESFMTRTFSFFGFGKKKDEKEKRTEESLKISSSKIKIVTEKDRMQAVELIYNLFTLEGKEADTILGKKIKNKVFSLDDKSIENILLIKGYSFDKIKDFDVLLEEVILNLGEMKKKMEKTVDIMISSMKGSEKKRKYMTPFILNSQFNILMCESEEEMFNFFLKAILYPFRYDEIVKKMMEKGERGFVKNLFYLGMESMLEETISTMEELNKKTEQILKIEDRIHLYIDEEFNSDNENDLEELVRGKYDKYIKKYPEFLEYKKFIEKYIKESKCTDLKKLDKLI